jgi:L-aspartate oxidase
MEKYLEYDYIIVGAGLAGLYAAWQASKHSKVALITKSTIDISNSYWAQGGIAAAIAEGDSVKNHYEDTISAGRGLCSKEAVEILVNEGKERVEELIELGMPFDIDETGKISLGLEGGHSHRRVLHSGGDATGKELVNFVKKLINYNPNITLYENSFVYKLISSHKTCFGICVYDIMKRKTIYLLAGCTIIASGGGSAIYLRTTNPKTATGEMVSIAYNIGAEVESMEFIQFHPTAFYSPKGDTFLISEAVRGEGAYLINYNGERFLLDKDAKTELSLRDVVTENIFNELNKTGRSNVFLDLRHLNSKKIKTRFSNIYSEALKFGVDITKDLIPVAPAAHYMIGGLKTGLSGETNVNGLYAIGEVASTGVHGANRLASNSLLECLVFAKRAIEKSKNESIMSYNFTEGFKEYLIDQKNEFLFNSEREVITSLLWENAGIVRNKTKLTSALKCIEILKQKYSIFEDEHYINCILNMVNLAGLIIESALIREETRGCHLREDFPDENPQMNSRIILKKTNA